MAELVKKNDTAGRAEGLPRHIAIIMDGNGRWAKRRGLPRTAGHAAGAKTFERIVDWVVERLDRIFVTEDTENEGEISSEDTSESI